MHITGQMTLRTLLSERSQTQKDTHCPGDSSVYLLGQHCANRSV